MKKIILFTFVTVSLKTMASPTSPKEFVFKFKSAPGATAFQINKKASTKEEAYKLAAKECFQKLTGGHYPGEEKGLEIIDICANPRM